MFKSITLHLPCKINYSHWNKEHEPISSLCGWHRNLTPTDHTGLNYLFPFTDNVQASNTCCRVFTSSAFIKSMNHIEHLKKQKCPKWYCSGRLWAHMGGGDCQHTSLAFPITVRLRLPISSSDRKQDNRGVHNAEKWPRTHFHESKQDDVEHWHWQTCFKDRSPWDVSVASYWMDEAK